LITIVDPVETYLQHLKGLFDFDQIRKLLANPEFKVKFDAMHAVSGQYLRKVMVEELGAPADCIVKEESLEDFGGHHPDPNYVYSDEFLRLFNAKGEEGDEELVFGAACDGDADRNLIVGQGFFVSPCDAIAIICYFHKCIPCLKELKGAARSMPTSRALDKVC